MRSLFFRPQGMLFSQVLFHCFLWRGWKTGRFCAVVFDFFPEGLAWRITFIKQPFFFPRYGNKNRRFQTQDSP